VEVRLQAPSPAFTPESVKIDDATGLLAFLSLAPSHPELFGEVALIPWILRGFTAAGTAPDLPGIPLIASRQMYDGRSAGDPDGSVIISTINSG